MLVTKSQYDSMGVGRNRCTKLVGFVQDSFVLHKAIPIYLFAITLKATCIKKTQQNKTNTPHIPSKYVGLESLRG